MRVPCANVGGFLGMNEKVVTIPADNLIYLKDRNLLVTDLSKTELSKLSLNDIQSVLGLRPRPWNLGTLRTFQWGRGRSVFWPLAITNQEKHP